MPPKKNDKPAAVEVPKEEVVVVEEVKQTTIIEQEGFGRFEYPNGMVYQGQWKIIDGAKMKHGEGTISFAGATSYEGGVEEYQGGWKEDKMDGYGVYKYTSGAIYSGEWKEGKHNGRGTYEFPDGTIYEGEFKEHRMHGEGYYIDKNGNRWEGEFVEGVYQSSKQQELKLEKQMKKKEEEIKATALQYFSQFEEAFLKSDKKTFKENLIGFFSTTEEIKSYVKEPYPKFEEKTPERWNDSIKWLRENVQINVLRNNTQAKFLDQSNILSQQFQGNGQIVEFLREEGPRTVKLSICSSSENTWSMVFFHDNAEPEDKKKK